MAAPKNKGFPPMITAAMASSHASAPTGMPASTDTPHASQTSPAASSKPSTEEISFTTRFGQITVNPAHAIEFPQGLFGFRNATHFALAPVPNMEQSPLWLMQCLNPAGVAFLVADPAHLGLELKDAERTEALTETRLSPENTQFLVILTYDDISYQLTANLKAPLLIDTTNRTGQQFILSSKAYSTQHKL